ncbi:MAG: hypothetical protein RIK87_24095 [Fuerstiella sp.]
MWKLLTGISLAVCPFAAADATPPESSVRVECCGRLRHGIVAIGGETTGTTITFNRIVWELMLPDDAAREFAKQHNKEPVRVTGTLRRIAGIEVKERWIVDVRTIAKLDPTKDREGTRLAVRGTLRATDPGQSDLFPWTIETDRHLWPIDLSADAEQQDAAASLIDRPVYVLGRLERVAEPATEEADEDESKVQLVIRVRTLKPIANRPIPGHAN